MTFVNTQILSGDNVNEGRIKINSGLDGNIYWSAGTGANAIMSLQNPLYPNSSTGDNSIAFGLLNQSIGQNSHAESLFCVSSGHSSHAQNHFTTAAGDYSHSGGDGDQTYGPVLSLGNCSFSHTVHSTSQTNTGQGALADYSAVLGGTDNSINANSRYSGVFGGLVSSYATEGDRISNSSPTDASNITFGGENTKIIDCHFSSIIGGSYSLMENGGVGSMLYSSIIGGRYNNMFESTSSVIIGGGDINYLAAEGDDLNVLSASTTSAIIGAARSTLISSENTAIIGGSGQTIEYRASFTPISGNICENCVMLGGSYNTVTHSSEGATTYGNFNSSIIGGTQLLLQGGNNNTIIGGRLSFISQTDNNEYIASGCTIVGGTNNELWGADITGITPKTKAHGTVIVGGHGNTNFEVFGMGSDDVSNCVLMGTGCWPVSANTWTMAYNGSYPTIADPLNSTIAFDFVYGTGYWDGTPNLGPADYAEYFEWNDGNPLGEDRVGYFTSLNGEKVEIGNTNIIGVVSANPAIVGDSAELKWQGVYEKDEWGRKLYGEDRVPIQSSNYDENQNYIPRRDRKEWSPIGLLGKLNVRTSEQITGTTISSDSNGMAINGSEYHVLESKKSYDGNYGVVKILFK